MTNPESKENLIDKLVYSPSEAVTATTNYLEQCRSDIDRGLGLAFPLPAIAQEYPIPPLLPGNIFMVLAVTSQGKSLFRDFWIAHAVKQVRRAKDNRYILISILAEDLVEEQMADSIMREAAKMGTAEDLDREEGLLSVAGRIGSMPIYYIGASISRASRDMPPPNMSNITRAIYRIIERRKDKGQETIVMGTFLDYIQAMPLDPELMKVVADKRRRLQVREDFFAFRSLCKSIISPGVCMVQAKIDVPGAPGKNMKTPGLTDTQETSAIAQHSDRGISLWMPWQTHSAYEILDHGSMRFKVLPNLFWMRIVKQRSRDPRTLKRLPAGRAWPLLHDFDTGEFTVLDAPEDTFSNELISRYQRRLDEGLDPDSVW